jgi:hypothetical protein
MQRRMMTRRLLRCLILCASVNNNQPFCSVVVWSNCLTNSCQVTIISRPDHDNCNDNPNFGSIGLRIPNENLRTKWGLKKLIDEGKRLKKIQLQKYNGLCVWHASTTTIISCTLNKGVLKKCTAAACGVSSSRPIALSSNPLNISVGIYWSAVAGIKLI